MFGIKGKLVSTKQRLFKLFRLISDVENEDSDASSPNPVFTNAQWEPLQAELKKAEALSYWFELRKAEALMHWRNSLDRPK